VENSDHEHGQKFQANIRNIHIDDMEASMTEAADVTMMLAKELTALDNLMDQDIDQLQRLVLDHVAVTLCGSTQPWGRIAAQWADRHGAAGRAALLGGGAKVGAATAGKANGTAAHGYELDDTHEKSRSHPGAVVITSALAVGAETGATGREIMTALRRGTKP
jgi:2-methylcitrate dehydratase PrpD